ncbi:hypothetical protein BJV74DRAFT_829082 [Russula compacta]|nr:hypothetical protein BJV74DRAFT_829082 [Russula compacta]
MSLPAPFAFSERVGLLLLVEMSAASACAIIGLLLYIGYSAVSITRDSIRRWRIGGAAKIYFLNQLAWDLVLSTGGFMNIKWAIDASVRPGHFCSAQGAIKQASDIGAAASTLIIALYTLKSFCFSRVTNHGNDQVGEGDNVCKHDFRWSLGLVICIWTAVGLIVAINIAADGAYNFYGPSGLWCWIQREYSVQQTAADYVFMWITATFNIVIYIILFLHFRGYITTDGWRMRLSRSPEPINIVGPLKQAYGLLFYPLVYTVVILPVSIVRYMTFAHHHIPSSVTILVDSIYLSSGLLNVLLFSFTRPFLLPHDPPAPNATYETVQVHVVGASQSEGLDGGANTEEHVISSRESSNYPWLYASSACDETLRRSVAESYEMDVRKTSKESLGI